MKYYIHSAAQEKDGKMVCVACGKELPNGSLKTTFPCVAGYSIPFDENVQISVWNCHPTVFFQDIALDEVVSEKEADKLYDLAVDSVQAAGGALNFSGMYPPSEKLVRFAQKLAQKYRAEILDIKLREAQEQIEKLKQELEKKDEEKFMVQRAVLRYLRRSEQDDAWLKELLARGIMHVFWGFGKDDDIKAVKQKFPMYYKTNGNMQDFTDDAVLLRSGYIIIEENKMPA